MRVIATVAAGMLVVATLGVPARSAEPDVAEAPVLDITAPVLDIVLTTGPLDGAVTDSIGKDEQTYVLAADVFFAFGSAELTDRARTETARIAAQIRDGGLRTLTVTGHTDSVGGDADNLALSQRRAEAVRAQLAAALPGVTLTAVGRGEAEPVAKEMTEDGQDDPEARARNRRVEIASS